LVKINQVATVSADVSELMAALVPLADLGRYGNVRKSDMEAVAVLVEGLVIRISIGLPAACYGLDEETAQNMFNLMRKVNDAVRTLAHASLSHFWFQSLQKMSDHEGIPAILRGCTHRLLLDANITDHTQAAQAFGLALSTGNDVVDAAAWLEGFLKGSGMILLYDETLWNILYAWVATLEEAAFIQLLPILRRTFVKFAPEERKKLGEKAKYGIQIQTYQPGDAHLETSFNHELAEAAMRAVAGWMPLETQEKS
jgi:hypothetical protein